jgi:hypothetical protein
MPTSNATEQAKEQRSRHIWIDHPTRSERKRLIVRGVGMGAKL